MRVGTVPKACSKLEAKAGEARQDTQDARVHSNQDSNRVSVFTGPFFRRSDWSEEGKFCIKIMLVLRLQTMNCLLAIDIHSPVFYNQTGWSGCLPHKLFQRLPVFCHPSILHHLQTYPLCLGTKYQGLRFKSCPHQASRGPSCLHTRHTFHLRLGPPPLVISGLSKCPHPSITHAQLVT